MTCYSSLLGTKNYLIYTIIEYLVKEQGYMKKHYELIVELLLSI